MSQPRRHHNGTFTPTDNSQVSASNDNDTPKPTRPQLNRPYSSPSTPRNYFTHQPTLSSSSSSTVSSNLTSTKSARPPNAVLPGISRPNTVYQAVTWKENLDAFNRRLRRGSMSQELVAQEEELLASEAMSHSKTLQHQRDSYFDQPGVQAQNAASELDENTRLLGNHGQSKLSYSTIASSGAAETFHAAAAAASRIGRSIQDRLMFKQPYNSSDDNGRSTGAGAGAGGGGRGGGAEPVFPTRLNPVIATTKSSKLGVFSGVFVPCVLSIWGIILFLRFGFIIAQAGVVGTMGMFVVGYAINIFTTMSLSAISTNGTVRGGGVYYLLSRSLGPEFGGSIGLIYFLCTVVGCGMNVLGFVEPLISNFGESSGTMYRVLPESPLWVFVYGTILLVSCTLVCLVGSKLFARSSLVLAVILLLSTLSIFVSFAVMPPFTHPERNIDYTGFSWETLQDNMWPRFTATNGPEGSKQSFQTVFGVLFPACIGILAGASMSGDLEDPSKSIPSGTLWAVGSTFCVYFCIVVLMGGSISRSTMYTDLSVLQDVSISPLFIASGALAASVFATLGSVIGAAKILQAIARDNLLPLLAVFGQGTPQTDEPTLAVLLTYILCQFCLFLTDMNAIATFVSLITLLTFLILNLACFLLKVGSAPNFRPSFRFFHWWTAFGGMVLSAVVMCFVDLGQSLLSGLMTAVLFIWIHYWSPPKRWGDVTQSLIYHQVRKYLLRLDSRKEHVKFWRPQILLLVHHPRSEYQLIQFCNHLKKGALYVLGHVILGDLRDVLTEFRRQQGSWLKFVDVLHIKAFVNLSVADNVRIGARNLLIGTGLGGMRPNIVVLGSFNLQRYLREKQELQQQQLLLQQQGTFQHQPHSLNLQKGPFSPATNTNMNNSYTDHTLLNIPVSLPIDNIRVEAPIKITDYVSIIEDVLSLNKAVAIGYGFDRLELPEEQKSNWKHFFEQLSTGAISPDGEKKKKKYIDLWPMQMSIAPLHRMAEATNFDTYAMVLQMGCILHMVPQWKDNYHLRVMVFVEYKEDVQEEKQRLHALLENLRIPAEVKVMCLDGGDSETYARLVSGESLFDSPRDLMTPTFGSDDEEEQIHQVEPVAPVAERPLGSPIAVASAHPSSSHYYGASSGALRRRNTLTSSTSPMESRLGTSVPLGTSMNFRMGVPLPRKYFGSSADSSESESDSISSEDDEDYDHNDDDLVFGGLYQQQQQQQQQQMRRLSQQVIPTTQRLYQQQPLQPSQQASTEQQQLSRPSTFAHTSLGSEQHGLGIALGVTSTESEQHTIGHAYPQQYPISSVHPYQQQQHQASSGGVVSSPWASSLAATSSSPLAANTYNQNLHPRSGSEGTSTTQDAAYSILPSGEEAPSDVIVPGDDAHHSASPIPLAFPHEDPMMTARVLSSPGPSQSMAPIQFDHLTPETQLMILNELMRIHSSRETTSIVFTTVPAPEEGTCLREQSSVAYLEKLDLLMDGIDIPVLLLHAKSLTVTMTL
ncbi:amino acid permease-domain-containing protein [Dissophora ornata]|nr:amino acid permease-domain-containing protein [Dissophora ornata]